MTQAYLTDLSVTTKFLIGAAVGAAGGLGVVVGWNLAEKKYHDIADQEIAQFKEEYHNESRRIAAQNEAAKDEIMSTPDLGYAPSGAVIRDGSDLGQVPDDIRNSIFPEAPAEEWDIAQEILQREQNGPTVPYIISQEEFMEGVDHYEQITLTYYEEDEVLADIKDEPVPEQEKLIGDGNLEFGRGSNDPNIVYVRNENNMVDLEIIRSSGSFAEEVHGITPIKHSDDRRKSRRMRDD